MLAARNVTVMRGPRLVLDQVDLSVDAGSRIGVLGRNGAGKSTLLRVIAGLVSPTRGVVIFADDDVTTVRADVVEWDSRSAFGILGSLFTTFGGDNAR